MSIIIVGDDTRGRMHVDETGNLGFGTSAPKAKLNVTKAHEYWEETRYLFVSKDVAYNSNRLTKLTDMQIRYMDYCYSDVICDDKGDVIGNVMGDEIKMYYDEWVIATKKETIKKLKDV
jgi:hypothetical protein